MISLVDGYGGRFCPDSLRANQRKTDSLHANPALSAIQPHFLLFVDLVVEGGISCPIWQQSPSPQRGSRFSVTRGCGRTLSFLVSGEGYDQ